MAGLLVSVRSDAEAAAALAGGASVIDIKEPKRGPLGRADVSVCHAVHSVISTRVPLSVALGELGELDAVTTRETAKVAGISYLKVGLSQAAPDWRDAWARLRRAWPQGPRWVGVAYSDWQVAGAPTPADVLDEVLADVACAGILVDTWDKSQPSTLDLTWRPWVERAKSHGRLVALAGRLTVADLVRLRPLAPDLFAVRGAACAGADRDGIVDEQLVSALVSAVHCTG